MSTTLLRCICGRSSPFQWLGMSAVYIACSGCGLELKGSAARVYWPDGDVPLALERYAYKPDGQNFRVVERDGTTRAASNPRLVSATAALSLYGHAERWNRLMRISGVSA